MSKKEIVSISWLSDMAFEGDINGHKILIDADKAAGKNSRGPSPKPFMLLALAGCTGMDVISILNKMRVGVDSFNVIVEGDLTEEFPRYYYKMHLIYEFSGKELPMDKLRKAVDLSQEKYCGVSAVYRKAVDITTAIRIIEP